MGERKEDKGKVSCPQCGAKSGQQDFGRESWRRAAPTAPPLAGDEHARRSRDRKRANRQRNATRAGW